MWRSRAGAFDLLLASGLTLVGLVEVWSTLRAGDIDLSSAGRVAFVALTAASTMLLALRRRWPLVVGLLVPLFEAITILTVTDYGSISTFIASLIALYSAGAWSESRWWWIILPARIVSGVVVGGDASDWAFTAAVSIAAAVAGRVVHRQRSVAVQLGQANEALRAERETSARLAVAEERTAIAREVHDILAHTVSVMVVQAEAAEALLDSDADRSRTAMRAVQSTGREALTELRRVLAFLRASDSSGTEFDPQPRLDRLDELVAALAEAGLEVSVTIDGAERHVAPGVDLCAYRIIQEALTNSLRHAGPGTARVLLRYGRDSLDLEVADDGGLGEGSSTEHLAANGLGIVGMRERVALYGGALEAKARDEGGFVVRASLPDAAVAR